MTAALRVYDLLEFSVRRLPVLSGRGRSPGQRVTFDMPLMPVNPGHVSLFDTTKGSPEGALE
jgi:hypothetical protein